MIQCRECLPVNILKVLVLPAPLTPSNPNVSLGGIPNVKWSTAVNNLPEEIMSSGHVDFLAFSNFLNFKILKNGLFSS